MVSGLEFETSPARIDGARGVHLVPTQNNRKRPRRRRPTTAVTQPSMLRAASALQPFPATFRRTLAYGEELTTAAGTPGTTSGTEYVFNLNSLYQPRSGGHQPEYFDQLMALYTQFRVHSVRIFIRVASTDSSQPIANGLIILQPAGGAISLTGIASAASVVGEKPNGTVIMLMYGGNASTQDYSVVKNLWELEGITRPQYIANAAYAGTVAASPTSIPTLKIASSSSGSGVTTYWNIRIQYDTEFFQRVTVAQS